MNNVFVIIICVLFLVGCMKKECKEQYARYYQAVEKAKIYERRPMGFYDLRSEDRAEIKTACRLEVEIGDIQGKYECEQELTQRATAGYTIATGSFHYDPSVPIPEVDSRCDYIWNH